MTENLCIGRVNFVSSAQNCLLICSASCLLHSGFLLGLLFYPDDGGDMFLRNVGRLSADYRTLYPRRQFFGMVIRFTLAVYKGFNESMPTVGVVKCRC
jgi:hypothetical protein